ncbi:MAG: MarR family transcriptional regulator [Nitriliruptoraceae bacterium]|nr:MarR family transcriptional regulator [Nitriliruptoraceae bacterium]
MSDATPSPAPTGATTCAGDPHATLEQALTRFVRRAFLPTAGEATRRRAGVNLERAAYVTLARIASLDGARLSDLAASMGLDVSTASRHAKRLVEDGYVEVAPDPDDARARRYTPTAAGRDALRRVRVARTAHLQRILHDWSPEELTDLAAGLERVVDALEVEDGEQR